MEVKFKHMRPVLWTVKLQESISFYTQMLGFTLDEYNEDWRWASLSKDDTGLMLAQPNEHEKFDKIGFTGSFYFNVNDVDKLWAQMKDCTKICYEIGDFPWEMREFAVYDNNGYILQFGQNL